VRAHARGHLLGEHVDRHARAAKHRIPAHDLVYQPILGRRSGRALARPGRRRCARFQKQSENIKTVRRKLAAIFAADVAGYSRLMARDA